MGSTYGTLETQMLRWLGNRDDDDTKAMLMAAFNWYQNIVSLVADWPELTVNTSKALTAGDYQYHVTTDWSLTEFRKMQSIKIYDGTRFYPPLDFITPIKWDELIAPWIIDSGQAKPSAYTMRGNYVLFSCLPEADIYAELWYYKDPAAVASTASTLELPTKLDQAMMALAVGLTWLGLEEDGLADKWASMGTKMLRGFNIDLNVVTNQRAASQLSSGKFAANPTYYSDPFVRRAP